jgi:hypothetical protein
MQIQQEHAQGLYLCDREVARHSSVHNAMQHGSHAALMMHSKRSLLLRFEHEPENLPLLFAVGLCSTCREHKLSTRVDY